MAGPDGVAAAEGASGCCITKTPSCLHVKEMLSALAVTRWTQKWKAVKTDGTHLTNCRPNSTHLRWRKVRWRRAAEDGMVAKKKSLHDDLPFIHNSPRRRSRAREVRRLKYTMSVSRGWERLLLRTTKEGYPTSFGFQGARLLVHLLWECLLKEVDGGRRLALSVVGAAAAKEVGYVRGLRSKTAHRGETRHYGKEEGKGLGRLI